MRPIIDLVILFFLGNFIASSQTIAKQSFEITGDTWAPLTYSTPPCANGNDIWNSVTSLPSISPNDGNQFWGIRNLDGSCGGSNYESVIFPNVNISSFLNVIFSFDYNAVGLDNNEDLKYELFYDDISQGEVIVVNGASGNADNTNGWLTETISIPPSVNNIRVKLFAKSNQGNDRAGFDNVQLQESTILNDNCLSATPLTVGTNNTENIITGTNVNATNSLELPIPTCANYNGNDIWYTAQVPASGILIVETQDAGSNIDTGVAIYAGACGTLTQVACDDDSGPGLYSTVNLSGQANRTVFIRVWAWNNASSGDFNIVAYSPPPPPNNDCTSAQSLTVGTDNTQNIVTGTNIDATSSGELPNPNCANYNGNDIWYTAQVPNSGILTVETQNAGSNIDTGMAIYTGSCGSLTQIDCDDDSGTGLYSSISLTNLANTTIYIRVWAYDNNTTGNFNIVAYAPVCPLTTRWNNSGWNNGAPNSYTSAIINSDYDTQIDGSFESCDCKVNDNKILNIRADDYITVHNDLTVEGTMEVRHEGSLVMTNDDAQVFVSGTLNVHKTTTPLNNYRDFTYWSSPVNTTIDQAFVNVDPNRIYKWDIPSSSSIGDWSIASGSMDPAKGYISEAPNTTPDLGTHSVTFTGAPHNGVINTPVGFNDDGFTYSDYNLVGNPYPSPINIDDFILLSRNNIMDGTIWIWTHNTAISNGTTGEFLGFDYATYNLSGGLAAISPPPSGVQNTTPTNNIASGQGFFIRTSNSGNLTFENAMRSNSKSSQFFRAPNSKSSPTQEKNRLWLNVESSSGGAFSQILIGFFENATDGFDRGYDGSRLGASWIDFYTKIESENYAIQGLGKFNIDKKVQIGFDTYIPDPLTYKISIQNMEGIIRDNEVYLIDHELNITHNLKLADYEFDVSGEGYFPDRFTLQFKGSTLGIEELKEDNNFIVTNDENTLLLSSNSIIKRVKVYDLMGRILIDNNPNSIEVRISNHAIKQGSVLVVNASFENNQSISKKVILH